MGATCSRQGVHEITDEVTMHPEISERDVVEKKEVKKESGNVAEETFSPAEAKEEKSEFQLNKEQEIDGFTYLPFETRPSHSIITLTRHLLTKRMSLILKDSVLDFTLIMSQLQQAFLQIQDRIQRRYHYYQTPESRRDNLLLQKDCCEIFETVLRESEMCCVTYCVKRDKLEKNPNMSSGNAKYIIMFSGLDNEVDPENNSGSLFAIWKRVTTKFRPLSDKEDLLQSCSSMIASGYCLYGQCMQLVLAINQDVNGFSYDPSQKEFILTHSKIKAAQRSALFSIDTSKESSWEPHIQIFLGRRYQRKDKKQNLRYVGSLVADAHRTLFYGGILMYPSISSNFEGEMSLVEAFIIGYIFEKAWGKASQGENGSIFQMKLNALNQKTQFYCGSSAEVVELENLYLSIARRQSINKSAVSRFSSNQSIGGLNNSIDLSVKSIQS